MPDIGSYAKMIQEEVLAAAEEHAEKMPDMQQERELLQVELQRAEDGKARLEGWPSRRLR